MQHTATRCNTLQERVAVAFVENQVSLDATHCNILQQYVVLDPAAHCNSMLL